MADLACDCHAVREPFTFANMTRCQTPGCEWQIVLPRTHCRSHGGDAPSYEYWEATDGHMTTRGFDFEQGCDCE